MHVSLNRSIESSNSAPSKGMEMKCVMGDDFCALSTSISIRVRHDITAP